MTKENQMTSRKIVVQLNFSEEDVQSFLNAANLGGSKSRQLKDLTDQEFAQLTSDIQDSAPTFKDEIIEGSIEGCANDWLYGWGNDEDE